MTTLLVVNEEIASDGSRVVMRDHRQNVHQLDIRDFDQTLIHVNDDLANIARTTRMLGVTGLVG